MISEYVREMKRYSRRELNGILQCGGDDGASMIRRLQACGVLRAVKPNEDARGMTELSDEDIAVADAGQDDCFYAFTFVGVIVIGGRVLKSCPKYLHADRPKDELKQVLKVLEKYDSKQQAVRMHSDDGRPSSNHLAVILFLLRDYFENGVYSDTKEIIEQNGSGEILWDPTISKTFALIKDNRPYYASLQTRRRVTDDHDYFKRLHESVLTAASKEMEDADLLTLFELTGVDLTEEKPDDFGSKDDILDRIERELSTQFHTGRQLTLRAIYAYIAGDGRLADAHGLSFFGTNSFHLVWEDVCAEILNNQLNTRLGNLKLPVPLCAGYDPNSRLIDLIERPMWTAAGRTAEDTLIPDMIAISQTDQGAAFIILDAKYYTAHLENGEAPKGQPGIESVAKQYLYQLAFGQFIADHRFARVENGFLMPTEQDEVIDKGEVILQMLGALGLKAIKIRYLPAKAAYECYLSGRKFDISILRL